MAVKAQSTISLASVKSVNDASQFAREKALEADQSATEAKNALQSVVQGATTVEKAVSVMQTALEAVVDYDPTTDTVQEYFWHDANGAHVLGDTSGYRNDITSTGMRVVDTTTEESVARFEATGTQVGTNESNIQITSNGISGVANGTALFDFALNGSTLAVRKNFTQTDYDANAPATISVPSGVVFSASRNTIILSIRVPENNTPFVGVSFTIGTSKTIQGGSTGIPIHTISYDGDRSFTVSNWADTSIEYDMRITYYVDEVAPTYSLGIQGSGVAGGYGVSEGVESIAGGAYSHAEGHATSASGEASHAEGSGTRATNESSHAEGYWSVASGYRSHAEGSYSEASGRYSHAQNLYTIAGYEGQTAIGKYNENKSTSLFEIGNGTNSARSNAFEVDRDGNVNIPSGAQYKMGGNSIVLAFYPVGSYYETSDTSFNPNTAWGGTWELEAEGQVHISAGSNYAVAGALTNTSDGGEATHKLSVSEMPSHTHAIYYYNASGNKSFGYNYQNKGYQSNEATSSSGIVNTGGGGAHNNMQPYIIVNRWHRTA